jgi:phosphoribulokinase
MRVRRPILLGIVGDSASGKSTLSQGIAQILGPERVTIICADDYHKYDRKERAVLGITPLHPECNYLDILEQHLERLRNGQPVLKPVYNHSTGTFDRPEYVAPKDFVIVDSLLGLYTPRLRALYDVRVFLDPPEELRRVWKVRRDVTKRGYTPEQVLAELDRREPDAREFIRPQRAHADIIVRFYPPDGIPPDLADGHLSVRLILRPAIPHPDLSRLLGDGPDRPVRLRLGRDSGKPVDILEVDGHVPAAEAAELEAFVWAHLPANGLVPKPETIGFYADGLETKHSHPLALTQLLIAFHMLYAAFQVGLVEEVSVRRF